MTVSVDANVIAGGRVVSMDVAEDQKRRWSW